MLTWLRKLIWSLLACLAVWFSGLVWFALQIPGENARDVPAADAIVILTGGKGRLEYGLQLLADGKGQHLFISGVGSKTTLAELLAVIPAALRDRVLELPPSSIAIGQQAENTIGNAEETARWVQKQHIASLLLVTANYHMPRGLSEFHEIMPQVALTAAPVFPGDASLRMILSEYHKYLAGKFRHWFISLAKTP